jgi:hypothetical protein
MQTIIPFDKTLQINNMLIFKSCKRSINNKKIIEMLFY